MHRLGDFEEVYHYLSETDGLRRAAWWYWLQSMKSILPFIKTTIYWGGTMFRNYLKVALRIIHRQKGYSIINVSGLALGMACCLLILLYVQHELSYDQFHENKERIYRIVPTWISSNGVHEYTRIAPAAIPAMLADFPEIEQGVRLKRSSGVIRRGDLMFHEPKVLFAEDSFFHIFSFPLLRGDPKTAIQDVNTVVLTQAMAEKYFGSEDPVGQSIIIDNFGDCQVTGVMENVVSHSHFHFDFLVSFKTLEKIVPPRFMNTWSNNTYYCYIMLKDQVSFPDFIAKVPDFTDRHVNNVSESSTKLMIELQPLSEIHLNSQRNQEYEANGNRLYVISFSLIAVFVLMIACVNFMNLATAQYTTREKEVGLRKVLGAQRKQLVRQFMGESILFSLVALILAVAAVKIGIHYFNGLFGLSLSLQIFQSWMSWGVLLAFSFFVGCLAGSYPAIFLSRFHPSSSLRGNRKSGARGAHVRRGLIVFQFVIAVVLIIATIIIGDQIGYMKNHSLGYNKEQKIVIPFYWDQDVIDRFDTWKQSMLNLGDIEHVTASGDIPGRIFTAMGVWAEGLPETESVSVTALIIDPDFFETYGMTMAEGRDFSPELKTDIQNGFIINEKAVAPLGFSSAAEAIGKRLTMNNEGTVIGVVKDFNYNSLHEEIGPLILAVWPSWFGYATIKINTDKIPSILNKIQRGWTDMFPDRPFEYFFFDDDFDRQYRSEERFQTLFIIFSSLSIFLAVLGLFGLAAFMVEQRTREIGIRKVLGGSIANIALLLSRNFLKWVLAANIIAWPVSLFMMREWLSNYAYRTSIGFIPFLIATIMVMTVTLIAVGIRSIRAATLNPVKTLKWE